MEVAARDVEQRTNPHLLEDLTQSPAQDPRLFHARTGPRCRFAPAPGTAQVDLAESLVGGHPASDLPDRLVHQLPDRASRHRTTRWSSRTRASKVAAPKVRTASAGVHTMGSCTLNDVFSSTGTPVSFR